MKRKKIALSQKLFLNKETISTLNTAALDAIYGGIKWSNLNTGCIVSKCNPVQVSADCGPVIITGAGCGSAVG